MLPLGENFAAPRGNKNNPTKLPTAILPFADGKTMLCRRLFCALLNNLPLSENKRALFENNPPLFKKDENSFAVPIILCIFATAL